MIEDGQPTETRVDNPGTGWHIPLAGKLMLNLTRPCMSWWALGAEAGFVEGAFIAQVHLLCWHPYLAWE